MSLVQAVITEDFILVGADKRGILEEKNIVNENCNKIVKINKGIIFGCTGGILDNYNLFKDFCIYNDELGLAKLKDDINISYVDFVDIISKRFQLMYGEHIDEANPRTYEIASIICGFNGTEFEVTLFVLGSPYDIPNGISKAHKAPDFPYKGVTAGKLIHNDNLHEGVYEICHTYKKPNALHYKNVMRNVFDKGTKVDNTINNIVCFEKIRKKDVVI